jgi:nucleotide-binding universal stress UspA family protein
VLTVNDDRGADYLGEDHGGSLLRHLAAHEGHVEIRQVSSHGAPIADVILAQASERDANLLIVGAYGRPRTTEILFGSITRALLAHTPIPLLISR